MLSALIVNLTQNVLSDLDNQTGRNQSNKAFLQQWSANLDQRLMLSFIVLKVIGLGVRVDVDEVGNLVCEVGECTPLTDESDHCSLKSKMVLNAVIAPQTDSGENTKYDLVAKIFWSISQNSNPFEPISS